MSRSDTKIQTRRLMESGDDEESSIYYEHVKLLVPQLCV